MKYPAAITYEARNSSYFVTFRDIPEATTQGDNKAEALTLAQDALAIAMELYLADNRPVPMPSEAKAGEEWVTLPLSVWSKVLLLNAMLEGHVTQAELARRMRLKPQQITRIVNLDHVTKIDTLAEAFRALGKEPVFSVA